MQKLLFLVSLLISSPLIIFCQDKVISLHPVIGDTIDKNEKRNYLLFPEIDNASFETGQIILKNNVTYLCYQTGGNQQMKAIDSVKISEYQKNISKISAYFQSKTKSDTAQSNKVLNLKIQPTQQVDITFFTPEMRVAMEKEARRYNALKGKAEELGLWGKDKENYIQTGGYNEFFSTKSKKKSKK